MTGTKKADTKKKGKANETIGVSTTSSMKTDDKKRKLGRRHAVKSREFDAFNMFMITDFLMRYYQNHPRPIGGLIPNDAEISGNIEWMNMSESEKASWIENVNNMKATGKTLYELRLHALNKLSYSKLDSKAVGVREGVVFLTYSSLIASSVNGSSRLKQLVQWCGKDYDGLIVFDEERKKLLQFSCYEQLLHPACLVPPVTDPVSADCSCLSWKEKTEEYLRQRRKYLAQRLERYDKATERKSQSLDVIRSLDLPLNPLDDIIVQLGGPDKVAEITGRRHRLVRESNGNAVRYEPRNTM